MISRAHTETETERSPALSSFLTQVSPVYLWTQAQQPISDLQKLSSYSFTLL